MEIESDKSDSTKVIVVPHQKYVNKKEYDEKKQIAKQMRKLKTKEKEDMKQIQFGFKNTMVKDLSYERKIFLLTDIVIDLDMFNENNQQQRQDKFDCISSWRPPVRITSSDNIVHIDLDTTIDGLTNFDEVSKILASIPNKNAYDLSQQIQTYGKTLSKFYEKNKDLMYVYNLISIDQKSKYTLNDYFEEALNQQMQKAQEFVKAKYGQNKYLSYMIKTRQRNNKCVTKYGYSKELLKLLGINSEIMYRLLYQNGPLLFYSNQDKINRLKFSLSRRNEQLVEFSWCNEALIYPNQTIITFDDLKFNCDIHMVKDNLTNDPNFFLQQIFMIQVALYDVNDNIIHELETIRNSKEYQNQICENTQFKEGIYFGLDYESQSEIFVQKYYCQNNNNSNNSQYQQQYQQQQQQQQQQ